MNMFETLLNEYLEAVDGAHGHIARPNDTFFASSLVSESFQWIRRSVAEGAKLNTAGARFCAGAACYLAYIAYKGYEARGFKVTSDVIWENGGKDDSVGLVAERNRNGQLEQYAQDFWLDTAKYLLSPPHPFPVMFGAAIFLQSLTLLSPEYCYMLGTNFMTWPESAGNWPRGEAVGGTDEDFQLSRAVLVQDLHTDVNLETKDDAIFRLSHWAVWPPYGWQSNDFGQYNIMTLVDQLAMKKTIPLEDGATYLRYLLNSQIFHIRNMAVRTLLLLGQGPSTLQETKFYQQALNASDYKNVLPHLIGFKWIMEGGSKDEKPSQAFSEDAVKEWANLARGGPQDAWFDDPALKDRLYHNVGRMPPEKVAEKRQGLDTLKQRYPGNWFVEVASAFADLRTGNPAEAEARLFKAAETTPGDMVAHLSLGGWLIENNRYDEAQKLYYDMVKRWPWDARAVGNAMWSITRRFLQ